MEELISEHLATWTEAQIVKPAGGRGRKSSGERNRYGIKKLRELILELAVRGKLVAQDPADEPASVLLERIAAEKASLLKAGKIKKQKGLPEVGEDEKPFGLPDGWAWAHLADCYDVRDGTHDSPRYQLTGFPLITSKNLSSGRLDFDNVKFISEEDHIKIIQRSKVDPSDILFAMIGSIGNPVIVDTDKEFSIKNVALFKYYTEPLCPSFLKYFLEVAASVIKENASGGVQAFVSLGKLRNYIIMLPPVSEQHRIAAKIDELMALCDRLEKQQDDSAATQQALLTTLLDALTKSADHADFAATWQRVSEHFDLLFTTEQSIDQLKQTILQLAVMGKLVPQDPDDEPASVLLEKITAEKARLLKEGKIKRQKKLAEIEEEEKPFDLPDGWVWARFPEVGTFGRGKSKHRPRNDPSLYEKGKYRMIQTGDVARSDGVVQTYSALYNDNGLAQSKLWPKGTMCITIAANIADSSILGFEACFPDSVVGLIPSSSIGDAKYFEYFMRTAKGKLMDFAPSTAQKNINLGILEKVYIPLPPVEEIHRIVTKVDELLTLCDTLKTRLQQARTTQVQLADALVAQAVA